MVSFFLAGLLKPWSRFRLRRFFFEKTLINPPEFLFVKGDIVTAAMLVLSSNLCHFVDSRHCFFRVSHSSKLFVARKKDITTFFFHIPLVIKDIGTLSCAPTSAVWNLGVTNDQLSFYDHKPLVLLCLIQHHKNVLIQHATQLPCWSPAFTTARLF